MEFRANLTVLELLEHKKIISSGYECVIHMHAIVEEAQISKVEAKENKVTKKMVEATYLLPGEVGKVVIKVIGG
jgi:peptide chain release factor subunit 3